MHRWRSFVFSSSYISRSSAHDMQFGSEQYGERFSLESLLKGRIASERPIELFDIEHYLIYFIGNVTSML
jgi:hypothetical protein